MPYPSSRRAAQAYAHVGLETEVLGASPERLISLLFRGARTALAQARHHLLKGDRAACGLSLSKAIDIVESGLKASLDPDRGGEVARSMGASYDLIVRDLLRANLRQDPALLEAADAALGSLADAWYSAVDPQFLPAASPS